MCTEYGTLPVLADETKAPIDTIFSQGPSNPYGKFFTGQSYLTMLSENDSVFNAPIGNVTFEPKARTFWHKHSGGQILLVISEKVVIKKEARRSKLSKKEM